MAHENQNIDVFEVLSTNYYVVKGTARILTYIIDVFAYACVFNNVSYVRTTRAYV